MMAVQYEKVDRYVNIIFGYKINDINYYYLMVTKYNFQTSLAVIHVNKDTTHYFITNVNNVNVNKGKFNVE